MSNKMKINKDEFLQSVSMRADADIDTVNRVYDAIVDEIKEVVCSGKSLSLTRFGTFSLKEHKGHPVQYSFSKKGRSADSSSKSISDYVVFKFDVSAVFMNQIREQCTGGKVGV